MGELENRLDNLEHKVDGNGQPGLIVDMASTKADISTIKDGQAELRGDFKRLQSWLMTTAVSVAGSALIYTLHAAK